MTEWFLDKAQNIVAAHFHKWYGFVSASFLLLVLILLIYRLVPDGKIRFLWCAYIIIFFEICLFIYWLCYSFWIPKNNSKHTGLVICIHADSNEAERVLMEDFISAVRKKIQTGEVGEIFNIITIKNHLAPKYNTFKSIEKLHKKVQGNIYIFGETKKRKHGDDQYFLALDGLVLHRPVAQQVSQELSKDFLATLPKGINFKNEFAFAGFQVSADIVVKSVEYIVGIAAFISGNPFLATKLHVDLKARITSSVQGLPGDEKILSKLDDLLSNEFAIIATYYLGKNDQEKATANLRRALDFKKDCYRALIVESIIAFSLENDPKKALSIIKKCHGVNDPTWRYNEAFLHFWQGNYSSAWKQCEKIRKQKYPNELDISEEVTRFNEKLLVTAKNDVLYFWLGFNYYFKQSNLPQALICFEKFLEYAMDPIMKDLRQKASSWLVDIKREGNWK